MDGSVSNFIINLPKAVSEMSSHKTEVEISSDSFSPSYPDTRL